MSLIPCSNAIAANDSFYNALTLGLLDLIQSDKFDEAEQASDQILHLFQSYLRMKGIADNFTTLRKHIKNLSEQEEFESIEYIVGKKLRKRVAGFIKERIQQYKAVLIEQILLAFHKRQEKQSDDGFYTYIQSYPSINALIEKAKKSPGSPTEVEEALKGILKDFFTRPENIRVFFDEMEDDTTLGSELEAFALGILFNIQVIIKREKAQDRRWELPPDIPCTVTEEQRSILISHELVTMCLNNGEPPYYLYVPTRKNDFVQSLELIRDDELKSDDRAAVLQDWQHSFEARQRETPERQITLLYKSSCPPQYTYQTVNPWLINAFDQRSTVVSIFPTQVLLEHEDIRRLVVKAQGRTIEVYHYPCLTNYLRRYMAVLEVDYSDEKAVITAKKELNLSLSRFKIRSDNCTTAIENSSSLNVVVVAILVIFKGFVLDGNPFGDGGTSTTDSNFAPSAGNSSLISGNTTSTTTTVRSNNTPLSVIWLNVGIALMAALMAFVERTCQTIKKEAEQARTEVESVLKEVTDTDNEIRKQIKTEYTADRMNAAFERARVGKTTPHTNTFGSAGNTREPVSSKREKSRGIATMQAFFTPHRPGGDQEIVLPEIELNESSPQEGTASQRPSPPSPSARDLQLTRTHS
jgi:hypothetical protein